jgi:RES domain-containing protein
MELFRISLKTYAGSLTSSGAANRWNIAGQQVLYAGPTRSLSTLELVVHRSSIKPLENYKVMVLSIADEEELIKQIQIKDLPADWRRITAYSTLQSMGSDWYTKQESVLLKVPSAIVIQEYNYVINTTHPEFAGKVSLVRAEDYFWDERLVAS